MQWSMIKLQKSEKNINYCNFVGVRKKKTKGKCKNTGGKLKKTQFYFYNILLICQTRAAEDDRPACRFEIFLYAGLGPLL